MSTPRRMRRKWQEVAPWRNAWLRWVGEVSWGREYYEWMQCVFERSGLICKNRYEGKEGVADEEQIGREWDWVTSYTVQRLLRFGNLVNRPSEWGRFVRRWRIATLNLLKQKEERMSCGPRGTSQVLNKLRGDYAFVDHWHVAMNPLVFIETFWSR